MNVVVFSDSHGRVSHIDEMMARVAACGGERPRQVLFLGDGLADLAAARGLDGHSVLAVRGNCDTFFAADEPETRILGLGNYRVLMMHGHTQSVKYGLTQAVSFAVRNEVDLLLYGHTHIPFAKTLAAGELFEGVLLKKPLCLFCPGALKDGSFGSISLTKQGILMSHGNLF